MVEVEGDIENGPDRSKKIKLDDLSEKISKQIDYYFSTVNVTKDKFLKAEIKKDNGWVKLSVLLTFARLKQLTESEDRVVQALKEYKPDVVELDEDKKQVKRKDELPNQKQLEEYNKKLDLRTVHISGFPTNYDFDQLRNFCSQFGEVESLAMRKHFKSKFFKGCIHVVFKREEDTKKVLDTEVLKCKDRELKTESMEQYHRRKEEMKAKRQEKRKGTKGESKTDDEESETKEKVEEKSETKEKVEDL